MLIILFVQSLLQDVQSHQRVLDAVLDRGHSLLQTAPNPEVERFMDDVQERHSALLTAARVNRWLWLVNPSECFFSIESRAALDRKLGYNTHPDAVEGKKIMPLLSYILLNDWGFL